MNKFILVLLNLSIVSFSTGQTTYEISAGNQVIKSKAGINTIVKQKESAVNVYIGFYQKYISSIRGQECPMYPSCSNFGLKTFNEKSFSTAFALTSDRLLRCGHDHKNYSLTLSPIGFRLLDYPAYEKPHPELFYSRNSYYYAYSDKLNDDSTFTFIKKLINNQYYQEALLEIMRVEFQADTFNIELFTNKIICLRATSGFEKALFEYETKCPSAYRNNVELLFQIALIQYKLQNYNLALDKCSLAWETSLDSYIKSRILMLNGLLYANKFEWESAMRSYTSLSESDACKTVGDANYQLSETASRFRDKSPTLAGVMSVVPGAGYAYSGHMQTAISALLINGLLAYATYTNFKQKNYGMGILTGVFSLSFYIGNIYGATKSAKRYNEQRKKSITDKLEFNTNF